MKATVLKFSQTILVFLATFSLSAFTATSIGTARSDEELGVPPGEELGRQTLPANDGWASFSTGTTAGSAATPDHVYTVRNQ